MNLWPWRVVAMLSGVLVLAGCGEGSGRSGTDLAVGGTVSATALNGGDPVTFEMSVHNRGDFDATGVVIRNASLQVSQASVRIACEASGGAACPATTGTSMNVDRLPRGGRLLFTVSGTLNPGASGSFANTMSVSADTPDLDPGNNSVTVSGTASSHDVGVTGSAPAGPLLTQSATFEFEILNPGPDAAEALVLTTTAVSNATVQHAQIACVASGGAALPAPQPDDTLRVDALPAGGGLVCAVPVSVALGTSGPVAVSMTAAAPGDARAGNNTAVARVGATLVSNLTMTGSAADPQVNGGATTRFDFVLTNVGPSTAFDVALTNTLSSDLTLAGAITCSGSGGAVVPSPSIDGSLVSPAVPAGGALRCAVPVTVAAGANGVVFDTLSARSINGASAGATSATATAVALSSDLGVSQTGALTAAAGTALSFTARVSNPGPSTATNLRIDWSSPPVAGVVFAAPTCVALNGAVCPVVLGPSMVVDSLLPGRTLVFTYTAETQVTARGVVESVVSVAADADPDLGNNTASASTTLVDPRNGSYDVFAADGRGYLLNIDFDAGRYTMSGSGGSVQRTFLADGDGYTVAGTARLRVATDLIVGGHAFETEVLPFVAARSFATNVQALAGSYNLFSRRLAANGTASTVPATAFASGNTLSVCESETAPVQTVAQCAAVDRTDFVNLTAAGSVFTGTSAAGESFSFKLANSGAAKILLAVGAMPDARQRLRIGLVDTRTGVSFGLPQQGPTSDGDWADTTLVDGPPVLWTSTGVLTSDSAQLGSVAIGVGGPFSLLTGISSAVGGSIYLMQAYPITVVIGGAPSSSPASGLLQIALP